MCHEGGVGERRKPPMQKASLYREVKTLLGAVAHYRNFDEGQLGQVKFIFRTWVLDRLI